MSKTIVVNRTDGTEVPFLRGILTRSLQDAGLRFNEAYQLASELRTSLSGVDRIDAAEIRERVVSALRERGDDDAVERYLAPPSSPATVLVRDRTGHATSFSRNTHQRDLQSCGLRETEAAGVTALIYEQLLKDSCSEISTSDLGRATYQALRKELGQRAARRYLVWTEFLRSERPLILLIGGTVGSGKSTVAAEIAHRLGIVRTQSTDLLREVMRMMIPKRLTPVLHTSSFRAWRELPFSDPQENPVSDRLLIEGFRTQAELLSVPCEAVINRALRERVSVIVEGVHMHPSLLERLPEDTDAIVVFVTLAVLDPEDLKSRIAGRGTTSPQRRAKRYLAHFDEIWRLQSFMLDEAERYDIHVIANDTRERAIQQVLATLNGVLSGLFAGTPETAFGDKTR